MEIGNGTSKVRNSENIEGEKNANGNQAVLLENRLKDNFISKNVVNLSKWNFNSNKTGLLEGSFFWGWGVKLTPHSYFKKNSSNINITLYNC